MSEVAGALLAAARDWLADDPDPETREELSALIDAGDEVALAGLTDRFSGLLAFGTAGLRGALGCGPNRMNLAVVIRAAAGIAEWVIHHHDRTEGDGPPKVAVCFDARHRSLDFAEVTAEVFAAAGIRALVLPGPLPTPVLAFAVRHLGAAAGVMVTASHNPPEDNGYKVYDASGRQIVSPTDGQIAASMAAVERVSAVPRTGPDDPDIVRLDRSVVDAYVEAVAGLVAPGGPREVRVGYTAMHGVGAEVLREAFARAGFPPPVEVAEQSEPDPAFPTVSFPNPEEPGALDLGLALVAHHGLDVLLANDPDADRLGVAVPDPAAGPSQDPSAWRVLRGDEIGCLVARHLLDTGRVPAGSVLATTIVSSTLLRRMAEAAGVPYVETLTGFKWISRAPGPGESLAFGYEEALGYCVDGVVADKDGIGAALVVAEMVARLRAEGRTVLDVLDDLALAHGLHQTGQFTVRVEGTDPMAKLTAAMAVLRADPPDEIAGREVAEVVDLVDGDQARGFEPSDVIILDLADARVVVRPSGTEPKLKCYIEVVEPVRDPADLPESKMRALAAVEEVRADLAHVIAI